MITKENTAAVVIWFRPTEEQKQKSEHYRSMVDRVYVVDNTENNRGIAAALNEGFRQAVADGYQWVLTMDQDSILHTSELQLLMQEANDYPDFDHTGLFSVCQVYGDPIRFRDRYEERLAVMCSGNLVRTEAFTAVGGFREELFIDCVDDDFCLRLHRGGWKVIMTHRVRMEHHLGNGYVLTPIFHHRYLEHNTFRHYYILRNLLYMWRDYPEARYFYSKQLKKRIKRVLLYDFHDRHAKLRQNWYAWRDYKKGIMGPNPHWP